MATAAFTAVLKRTGTAVSMTGEACTLSGGDTIATVTDTTKRVLDPTVAITLYDNGTPVADTGFTVNYLFGTFTKAAGSFTGPMTVDASYLPTFAEAEINSFEVNLQADLLESTTMAAATTTKARTTGLTSASGTLGGLDTLLTDLDTGGGTMYAHSDLTAGTRRAVEITFPGGQIFRSFVFYDSAKVAGEIGDLVKDNLSWQSTTVIGTDQTEGNSFGFSS